MSGIVIIEEDEFMRELLAESLAAEGYRVNGIEAGAAATGRHADLVIADVYMPRQLGAERLRAVRSAYPGTPIIAISGQFGPGVPCTGQTAGALGVDRVIAKPFDRNALLEAVRSLIGPPR